MPDVCSDKINRVQVVRVLRLRKSLHFYFWIVVLFHFHRWEVLEAQRHIEGILDILEVLLES